MHTVLYPVSDLERAKTTYSALLNAAPTADSSYYVGYDVDGVHLGLVPNGERTGPVPHWHVADLEATIGRLTETGATELEAPHEVGGGRRVALMADADGNRIGLIHDR